ncbi:MAG: SpoVR family protein [Cyanobacteria bacterium]|nr:SpoVR family protein [Cyanobacteriota bacterium]
MTPMAVSPYSQIDPSVVRKKSAQSASVDASAVLQPTRIADVKGLSASHFGLFFAGSGTQPTTAETQWTAASLAAAPAAAWTPQGVLDVPQELWTPEQILSLPGKVWTQQPSPPMEDKVRLVGPNSYPTYYYWQEKILVMAKELGLDPYQTNFYVASMNKLASIIGRVGMPAEVPHWSFGKDSLNQFNRDHYGMGRVYELVINSDPCYAYLLENNNVPVNQLVIAHVYGHNHFFRHNPAFADTNRQMPERMVRFSEYINGLMTNGRSPGQEEVEKYLDKLFSLEQFVDHSVSKPRALNPVELSDRAKTEKFSLPDDFGKRPTGSLPSHMSEMLDPEADQAKRRSDAEQQWKDEMGKTPLCPDDDVLAYVIENSRAMQPWQRDLASNFRERIYYFQPQKKTKIMNEGFATIVHKTLIEDPRMENLGATHELALLNAGVMAAGRSFNPYLLGYTIFKEIKDKYDKGQHGPKWESIKDPVAKANYDDHSMKGWEKVLEVVRNCPSDVEFLRNYVTKDTLAQLYRMAPDPKPDPENPDAEPPPKPVINDAMVEKYSGRLISMLVNGGEPVTRVLDGNYRGRGELLLEHTHEFDLHPEDTAHVGENLQNLWGQSVHLNSASTKLAAGLFSFMLRVADTFKVPLADELKYALSQDNAGAITDPELKPQWDEFWDSFDTQVGKKSNLTPQFKQLLDVFRGMRKMGYTKVPVRWSFVPKDNGEVRVEQSLLNAQGEPVIPLETYTKMMSSREGIPLTK